MKTRTSILLALLALAPALALAQTETPDASTPAPAAEPAQPAPRGLIRRPTAPAPAEPGAATTNPAGAPAASSGLVPSAPPETDAAAHPIPYDRKLFRADPDYSKTKYDAAEQEKIYGGKHGINMPRPLIEFGYPMYAEGAFGTGFALLGEKNLVRPQFLVYGDWRLATGVNQQDDGVKKDQIGVATTRLNLDVDLKLTGTERLHFLFRPLDRKGKFTRYTFKGKPAGAQKWEPFANGNLVTGFLEGDLGAIVQGITGDYNHLDLPFSIGFVPLLFQNGVWMDDAIIGGAFSIPAMNSPALDISNFDITFFGGFDKVSTPAIKRADGEEKSQLIGVATFLEIWRGYVEAGYGYVRDRPDPGALNQSFHSVTAAFTKRYGGWLSNSVRVIGAVGQKKDPSGKDRTANGVALLVENSYIGSHPYTLVPYFNLFYTNGTPQSLARDGGAGGLLKNTGINFESDGLAGVPKIDDTGADAYGGALGVEYLFNLDQQLVGELATVRHEDGPLSGTTDYAVGLRWQLPFCRQWIIRADAMAGRGNKVGAGGTPTKVDLTGARLELRVKF